MAMGRIIPHTPGMWRARVRWGRAGLAARGSRRKVRSLRPGQDGGKGIPTFRLRNQARALKCHRKSLWSKSAKPQASERIRLSESDSAYRSGTEPPSLMRECLRQLGFLTVLETAERVWSGAAYRYWDPTFSGWRGAGSSGAWPAGRATWRGTDRAASSELRTECRRFKSGARNRRYHHSTVPI